MNLTLKGDASADLQRILGELRADVAKSSLRVDDVRAVAITANDADITVSAVKKITTLHASFSELDLDLTDTRGQLALRLQQGSRARVRLLTPCQVRTSGPGSGLGNEVTVNGCAYAPLGRRSRTVGRGVNGQRTVVLSVNMAQGTELEVDGVP